MTILKKTSIHIISQVKSDLGIDDIYPELSSKYMGNGLNHLIYISYNNLQISNMLIIIWKDLFA